jgi:hypothetical protein
MTTATHSVTLPPARDLDRVERLLVEATNALDELSLDCRRYSDKLDSNEAEPPKLEELGRLSRFIACAEQDVDVMSDHMKGIRDAHQHGAIRIECSDAS